MANLGDAYVQIIPSAKGIGKSTENVLNGELAGAGEKAGGSLVGTIVKGLMAAGTVKAVGDAFKTVISAGADLQQSIGGIETLFKDSAGTVMEYAANAYQTAGISANDYMSNVTRFSASLLKSLGGDTAKAAEIAQMAMVDMSDNANKMGTDMESIKNAYQGFAKNQYQLLDNLSLGYGGSKTEMQRLLKDAQELSGVEYNIDNLSDVYEAIHVVQEELGITGTTALEASTTITGSFNAVKAAFSNVLGNLALGENIVPSLMNLFDTTKTFLVGNLLPMASNIISGIFTAGIEIASSLMPADLGAFASDMVSQLGTFITSTGPQLIANGLALVGNLVGGLLDGLPGLISTGASLMSDLIATIMSNAPQMLSSGLSMLSSFVSGIVAKIPAVVSAATSAAIQLITTIASNAPQMLQEGITLLGEFVAGLISRIPDAVSAAISLGQGVLNQLASVDWIGLGTNMVMGIVNGVKGAAGALWDAMVGLAQSALGAAKAALGIHSPSRVFRDQVGHQVAAGMALGIDQGADMVDKSISDLSKSAGKDIDLRVNSSGSAAFGGTAAGGIQVVQNIYSEAKRASDLMIEARYNMERGVLFGI